MKNIAICYHGGCGGHFIFYYLLASNFFSHRNKYTNSLLNEKHIKNQFYFQFKEKGDWLEHEIWPENQYQEKNQLFLCCQYIPEKNIDCIKICPYISDFRDWFRTVLYKKTNILGKLERIATANRLPAPIYLVTFNILNTLKSLRALKVINGELPTIIKLK